MSRVFISHSGRDNAWAVAVKQWLVDQQPDLAHEIFLDVDPETGIHSGQRWKDALRTAKERCEAVVCLVSRNWLGSKECEAEYRAAEYFGKRIYAARIEPLEESADITREWQRCDLYGDGPHTEVHVDFDGEPVVFRTAGLQQLLTGLRSAGIGTDHFPWPPIGQPDRAPYRGWDPFEPVDAAVFFGRDGQVLRAVDALRAMRTDGTRPLFVIVGASGTGKSSFLRAGLIPRLDRDDRHFVVLDIMRPERNALTGARGLAAVVHATRQRLGLRVPDLGDIKSALAEQSTAAVRQWLIDIQQAAQHRLVDVSAEAPTLVLPIDQAEELLSADAGPEAARMLELLAGLLAGPVSERVSLIVVLTIRSDRYEHLQSTRHLADVETVVFDDLKPMPLDRFRDIIIGPARRSPRHLEMEPALVDQLLADCGDGADTLPLLSLTLATLYRDYGAGGALTRDQYIKHRGIGTVVATEIATLLSHDPTVRSRELALLRSAFIPFLATIAPDTEQPLRRIARWNDLPVEVHPLIDRFVERRLLVKDHRKTGNSTDETVVEVALESLLRQWDDLAGWLREEADDLRTAENLERAADDWNRNNHGVAWLLTGARLVAAESLAARPGYRERLAATSDYLNASRKSEDNRHADELAQARAHAQSLRRRAQILFALATVAVLVAVTAGVYYLRANSAEHRASDLADASIATRLVQDAQQQFTLGRDERRGILEILAAHAISPGTARTALLAAQYQTENITKIADIRDDPSTMAVSPDGRWIVTGVLAGGVRLWDTMSGGGPRILPGAGSEAVGGVAVSGDGRWVVAGDFAGGVRLWDMTSGGDPSVLPGAGSQAVETVAVSEDGRRVVTGDTTGVVRVWDTTSGGDPSVLPGAGSQAVETVAVSDDGRWVVAGDFAGGVRLWDMTSGGGPRVLPGAGSGAVGGVAVSGDGRWVVAGDFAGGVRLWDMTSGGGPRVLPGAGSEAVGGVAVSRDGRWVVAGDKVGAVRVWDMTSGDGPHTLPGTGSQTAWAVAVSGDGRWVVAGDEVGVVRTWDTTVGRVPRPLPGTSPQAVGEVAVSPDKRWVVAGNNAGEVRVWDTKSGGAPSLLPNTGSQTVRATAVSPNGHWIVVGDILGVVRVWDMTSGSGPRTLPGAGLQKVVQAAAVSPSGRWVVAGDDVGVVRVWDTTSDGEPRALSGTNSQAVRAVAVSPDGRWVVAGDDVGVVRVWDTTSDSEPRTLPGVDSQVVQAAAVSPDGRWIAAGNDVGEISVWSTDANQPGVAPAGHIAGWIPGLSLAFDPRMQSINAMTGEGGFIVLPFPAPEPEQLCSKLTTTISQTEWDEWVTPKLSPVRLCKHLKPLSGS